MQDFFIHALITLLIVSMLGLFSITIYASGKDAIYQDCMNYGSSVLGDRKIICTIENKE